MWRKNILPILMLSIFIFPIFPLSGFQPTTALEPLSTPDATWGSSQSITQPTSSRNPYEHLLDSVPSPQVTLPEAPKSAQGYGLSQIVQPQWHLNETHTGEDQDNDFSVYIEKGLIYREVLSFTRFGIPNHFDIIWGEDWPPVASMYYYPVGMSEVVFISFNATWYTPIIIQGFWLNFWDGSKGPIELTVFGAKYNATSGFNTEPDLTNKISSTETFDFGPTAPALEEWVYFDWTPFGPIILDPLMTYNNMFYLALSLNSPSAKVDLNLCEDSDPVDPDYEDEADVWIGSGGPPLVFYPWDFYLDVEILRYPYPDEISLAVNSTAVQRIDSYPGIGVYDSGYFSETNVTDTYRFFNVSSTEPGLVFDVTWFGWFIDRTWVPPRFTVYANETFVDWQYSYYLDIPDKAYNRVIYATIEQGWSIVDVLRDGISHPFWSRIESSPFDYIQVLNIIDEADYTFLCQSHNHVAGIDVLDETWTPVTEVNATEGVLVRGYIEESDGRPISTGNGFLNVYDPNDVLNHTDVYFTVAGQVDLEWTIFWTVTLCEVPGVYTLNVIWTNQTAAGMNSTTLTVNPMSRFYILEGTTPPGSEVIKGTDFQIVVFYSDHAWNGLSNATLDLQNVTGPPTTWQPWSYVNLMEAYENETYAGYYVIWAHTNESITDLLMHITLSIIELPYPGHSYSTNFTVVQAPILQLSFLKERGTAWDPVAHHWHTSPEPYINQTDLEFTVRVHGRNNTPVTGVTLYPVLRWLGRVKILLWADLHVQGGPPGLYNITVDMSPIHGVSFHVGDTPIIEIYLEKDGYEPGVSETLHLHPQARPSFIDIPNPPPALYTNWTYLIPLRVVLRDGLTGEDVSHGTVTINIPYLGNITLDLATPGLGLYEITSLTTTNIPPGDHLVTLYASANDYQSSTISGVLTILPKSQIHCTVIQSPIPQFYGTMYITIQFFTSNGAASTKSEMRQVTENLPAGTKVTVEARGEFGDLPSDSQYLDENGIATFQTEINHDDHYTFYVTIDGAEDYWGLDGVSLNELAGVNYSFEFIHPMTMILSLLPIIIIVLVILIGSSVLYRQKVMIPKRKKKLAKYQAIADTFSDVANLNRLLVLHKESGICVFDPFAEESQDATLVAGFLQAISTFGHDLGDSHNLANDSEDARTLRELQYEGFRILINDSKFVRVALVLSGTPSEQLRQRLETFSGAFENRYKADFEHWEGRVDQFNSASDLVEEVFLISLRHPHSVATRKPRGAQLSSLESDIYKLSKELTKDREYIFLGQILSTYLAAAKTDKLEALMAIYQLRMKGVYKPMQLAPVPPDAAAG